MEDRSAVYFGGEVFNARVNGKNFSNEELVEAIQYAKLRGVKTHLTLNILIKTQLAFRFYPVCQLC